MKDIRFKITAVITLIVFLILAFATVLAIRADFRFIFQKAVELPDKSYLPKEISIKEAEIEEYTFEALSKDNRVVFEDSLILINEEYTLKESYVPSLIEYGESGHKINKIAVEQFAKLATAVNKECNEELLIVSSYRNADEQLETIEEEGENAAAVNASEHLTGLSADVCVKYFGGNAFLKSETGRFVNSKCGDYGFIIRYPLFAKSITGIGYEPWHIRYIGLPHSKIIEGAKLTLEEYIEYFEIGKFYSYENYIIVKQTKDNIKLPKAFKTAYISEDNTGCYIITIC